MPLNEKARQTIISKWGSIEAYNEWRYKRPENAEKRKRAASIAGKATKVRTFDDPKKAREASKKSWENRRNESI